MKKNNIKVFLFIIIIFIIIGIIAIFFHKKDEKIFFDKSFKKINIDTIQNNLYSEIDNVVNKIRNDYGLKEEKVKLNQSLSAEEKAKMLSEINKEMNEVLINKTNEITRKADKQILDLQIKNKPKKIDGFISKAESFKISDIKEDIELNEKDIKEFIDNDIKIKEYLELQNFYNKNPDIFNKMLNEKLTEIVPILKLPGSYIHFKNG